MQKLSKIEFRVLRYNSWASNIVSYVISCIGLGKYCKMVRLEQK